MGALKPCATALNIMNHILEFKELLLWMAYSTYQLRAKVICGKVKHASKITKDESHLWENGVLGVSGCTLL